MNTKRNNIESLREKLREKNADSTLSNKFLHNALMEQARWLIKREISAGRIYRNNSLFQTLGCVEIIEISKIDSCCPINTDCKIYRTNCKLPEMWIDNNGPVIRKVTSVDGSTEFIVTSPETWQSKNRDPYQKMSKAKYCFPADGYLWFPKDNPHRANIVGFYTDDISQLNECSENKECIRYLDTPFMLPDWLESEMFARAIQQIASVTLKVPEDENINKNTNRKD